MAVIIRTQSLRHALNDLRAAHTVACGAGTADDYGEHLPRVVHLDDGTYITIANALARHAANTVGLRIEEGLILGFFIVTRRDAAGKRMSTSYVP